MVEGESPRLEIDSAELQVIRGPDRGCSFKLGVHNALIGSSAICDLVLHDTTISARHAEIVVNDRGCFIRDLESTNGVRIGGLAVVQAPLAAKMRLGLGETTLLVRSLGEHESIALGPSGQFGRLVAHSVKMRAAVAVLEQLAGSDITVLIEGETGTGKEVAAEALHARGARTRGPFVVFDCAAVQPSLLAAELFGSERGAFTGSDSARAGLLEEAEGGTLFIDEVGELPLELQPALLRVIERKSARRIGGQRELGYDVRIIAATNRNLGEEVRAGRFREDLFYRLAVARVRLPPLRERPEDILRLIDEFSAEADASLSPELRSLCLAHAWPGNVRELRNAILAMVAHPQAARAMLVPAAADAELGTRGEPSRNAADPVLFEADGRLRPLPEARRLATDEFERRYLGWALEQAGGRLLRAAELSGVSRRFMARLATKHRLRAQDE